MDGEIARIHRLFAWDDWANREVLENLRRCGAPPPPKSVRWLAHVAAAERLWWGRMAKDGATVPVWPEWTLDETEKRIEEMSRVWAARLRDLSPADLSAAVGYKNSKGESFVSTVGDILTHVVTHSAYHRGQIAADVRAAGFEPAYTDFIHCVRQGLVTPPRS